MGTCTDFSVSFICWHSCYWEVGIRNIRRGALLLEGQDVWRNLMTAIYYCLFFRTTWKTISAKWAYTSDQRWTIFPTLSLISAKKTKHCTETREIPACLGIVSTVRGTWTLTGSKISLLVLPMKTRVKVLSTFSTVAKNSLTRTPRFLWCKNHHYNVQHGISADDFDLLMNCTPFFDWSRIVEIVMPDKIKTGLIIIIWNLFMILCDVTFLSDLDLVYKKRRVFRFLLKLRLVIFINRISTDHLPFIKKLWWWIFKLLAVKSFVNILVFDTDNDIDCSPSHRR